MDELHRLTVLSVQVPTKNVVSEFCGVTQVAADQVKPFQTHAWRVH
jgi:hypothetical protein